MPDTIDPFPDVSLEGFIASYIGTRSNFLASEFIEYICLEQLTDNFDSCHQLVQIRFTLKIVHLNTRRVLEVSRTQSNTATTLGMGQTGCNGESWAVLGIARRCP